jgi:transcriptional regulator with XRE-family HTH domain
MSEPVTLGRMLAALRAAHRFSYRDLGRLAGLSAGYLCEVEKGRKGLSAEAAIAVARALDVSPRMLLGLWIDDELRRAGWTS